MAHCATLVSSFTLFEEIKLKQFHTLLVASLITLSYAPAFAAGTTVVPKDGFLCCNLRVSGAWASDANSQRSGGTIMPAGTRVIGMAYGSSQVDVEIGGRKVSIGNDYSRDMTIQAFAQRWIVPKDPREALRDWSPKVQQAVKAGRIMKGMNRKQVLMSLGWPTTGSTPNIDDPVWNYPAGFKVIFNERWAVKAIDADDTVKKQVVMP
jgi:hypothetical protein